MKETGGRKTIPTTDSMNKLSAFTPPPRQHRQRFGHARRPKALRGSRQKASATSGCLLKAAVVIAFHGSLERAVQGSLPNARGVHHHAEFNMDTGAGARRACPSRLHSSEESPPAIQPDIGSGLLSTDRNTTQHRRPTNNTNTPETSGYISQKPSQVMADVASAGETPAQEKIYFIPANEATLIEAN